jgi:hypothetical protein
MADYLIAAALFAVVFAIRESTKKIVGLFRPRPEPTLYEKTQRMMHYGR